MKGNMGMYSWAPSYVREFFALLQKNDPDRYHYFLWLKFILLNVLFAAFFALSFFQGWVDAVFAKDPKVDWMTTLLTFHPQTTYVLGMLVVFLVGLFFSFQKVFETSREINCLKESNPRKSSRVAEYLRQIDGAESGSRLISLSALSAKWHNRQSVVRHLANMQTGLGLLGTVLGLVMAVAGVNANVVGDASTAGPLIAGLVSGMGFALYTTVAGGFLGQVWLLTNAHIIRGGSVDFLALLCERGEREVVAKQKQQNNQSSGDG